MSAPKTDNRVKKLENEMRVLRAISRCAYLRATDLADLVWPNGTGESPVRLAQRTTKTLKENGELLDSKVEGSTIFYVTEKGARRLNADGHDAKSGKDGIRSLKNFVHRCKCNTAYIHSELAGRTKNFTEHEILGHRGDVYQWYAKRPDLLVWGHAGEFQGWWWVEVENTRRNSKELTRIDDWLRDAVHPQFMQNYPLVMGASSDVPLLGVVILFSTSEELVDLWDRMKASIEKWILSHERSRDIDFVVAENDATEFLQSLVHFVLLSDFSKWLAMEDVDLY